MGEGCQDSKQHVGTRSETSLIPRANGGTVEMGLGTSARPCDMKHTHKHMHTIARG